MQPSRGLNAENTNALMSISASNRYAFMSTTPVIESIFKKKIIMPLKGCEIARFRAISLFLSLANRLKEYKLK